MATDMHIAHLQFIIGYEFMKVDYLVQALTATGADEEDYDGNRKLAQIGESLIECVLLDLAYMERSS